MYPLAPSADPSNRSTNQIKLNQSLARLRGDSVWLSFPVTEQEIKTQAKKSPITSTWGPCVYAVRERGREEREMLRWAWVERCLLEWSIEQSRAVHCETVDGVQSWVNTNVLTASCRVTSQSTVSRPTVHHKNEVKPGCMQPSCVCYHGLTYLWRFSMKSTWYHHRIKDPSMDLPTWTNIYLLAWKR